MYWFERFLKTSLTAAEKVISTRWVDINKKSEEDPFYRSRLVARELRLGKPSGIDYFAATPPADSFKMLLSLACTDIDFRPSKRKRLAFIDVSRAHFWARPSRRIHVTLPPEDPLFATHVALLKRSMYGLRTAAHDWECEVERVLHGLGFATGRSSPCIHYHEARDIKVSVHGDDFTILATESECRRLHKELEANWTLKLRGILGVTCQEIDVLNRIVSIAPNGAISMEADPRHVQLLHQHLGLQHGSKGLSAPRGRFSEDELSKACGEREALSAEETTLFRSATMRAAYVGQDRCDIQFAVKELAREMHKPTTWSMFHLKHLGRYLIERPRAVTTFEPQRAPHVLVCEVDADYAGDKVSRKSTSGGLILHGRHVLKTWSSTQAVIALSTGESELYALVKGFACLLGVQSMCVDLGLSLQTQVATDSSAAKALCERKGLGKAKHIHTSMLWVQQALASKRINSLLKVPGKKNRADIFTKALNRTDMNPITERMHIDFPSGKSKLALDA